jgi:hypothetical protein
MAYLIKIKDHLSDSECVINKKTCLKNWKNDFLTVFKVLTDDTDSFIDLNIEAQSMNILKREKIVKKGYLYNTSGTVDKIIYSLSLIKFETMEELSKDASTNTESKVTFNGQTECTQGTQTTQLPKSTESTQTTSETSQETKETQAMEATEATDATEATENEIINRFENKYKYDDRLYPQDYFYSDDSCNRFDYFTKIYNPSYQNQSSEYNWGHQSQEQSHYYYPVPTEEDIEEVNNFEDPDEVDDFEEIDIRIDPEPFEPPKNSKQDLINELKTKLYQPNYGLNYSNGYKLL